MAINKTNALALANAARRGSLNDLGKLLDIFIEELDGLPANQVVESTDAGTLALTVKDHAGRTVYFSDADGDITLPNATGSGVKFKVVIKTAATAMTITVTPSTDEEFAGALFGVDDDADAPYAWKAEDDDDTISLNGTATGGKVGDWFEFEDIATGIWLVSGQITQSGGAEATPFSAAITA